VSAGTLDRRAVAATLLRDPGDLLVVSGLGSTTYDVGATGDRALNFYLWGAMGAAAMVGLGLALAQADRRVLVVTGDGEMLMGLGALATIAALQPRNLAIAVMDNGSYAETGEQPTHTSHRTDLAAVALGCGWSATTTARTMAEVEVLRQRLRSEPLFAVVKIAGGQPPRSLPPRDGSFLQHRFRIALRLDPID
jgi:thiamine pyrophosphate-dependent acetolactate synthase large subunit-like protein